MERDKYRQITPYYFINERTGDEFKIGDTVYLTPDHSIGCKNFLSGRTYEDVWGIARSYKITSFYVADQKHSGHPVAENNGNFLEMVYANGILGQSHLSWIMTEHDDKKFRATPMDRQERNILIQQWKEYHEKKENKSLEQYYITI